MEHSSKQNQLGVQEGDLLKLEIDPKSHAAWTGWKTKVNGQRKNK